MIANINCDFNINKLEIKDVIDINLLQKFQDNFAESMDIASVTVDRSGNPVTKPSSYTSYCLDFVHSTKIGDDRCAECHKKAGEEAARLGKPHVYICHAGLTDFAAPILVDGIHIGTILGGQVLTKEPEESKYRKIAKDIDVDEDGFINSVKDIKKLSDKNVSAAAEVLFIVANSLSKIGYEELKLKTISKNLEIEMFKKNMLIDESNEYNNLKTQLFSTLSHELKTPINIIYGSLQLLNKSFKSGGILKTGEIFLKYSKIMKQNCHRLIRLTDNLIDMNKIEVGFYSLNLKNSNIVKVIEDITLSIVKYAKLKDINVIFDTEIEEKITAFDKEKVERIILNLLSNSIKFTDFGGKISVTIYDKKDKVVISVKDTGIGIPQDMIGEIFNTFTQVDASFRRHAEGSGIGLSLVKSLVKMHGGEIKVKSELGVGSEFTIILPAKVVKNEIDLHKSKIEDIDYNAEKTEIELSDIYFD